jgi:transcriptional regulator with GAF, ATPase, and Fis domain
VSVNCAALPETLLESELFGHMKGAFTDAHQSRKGLFETAHRGTLMLDEVGEMPMSMQVKLLRALQEKRVRRVGAMDEVEVDVRVIAATNRTLDSMVRQNQFREDLFYRLNVIPIDVPALRERREDIPLLAEHFLRAFAREMGKEVSGFAPEAMERLVSYGWPGNVRELENTVERAVALESGRVIRAEQLSESTLARQTPASTGSLPEFSEGFSLDAHLSSVEAELLRRALRQAEGDRSQAARILGVTPRSLRYLISKHLTGAPA